MNLTPHRAARFLLGLVVLAPVLSRPALAKLETWRQETSSAFTKGRRERVVVSDGGRIRLGQALSPIGKLDVAHVWDLARTDRGVLFAATGDEGKVFRREAADDAPWTLAFDAADTQAFALACLDDGRVFVGTGPSGQVVEVTDPKHPATRPGPAVQYIWDLAADPQGNLFAATGPKGQLWKRSADGAWSLSLDSRQTHLLSVAVGADGAVYAGSDGAGLIYRVAADGKASVVYDAPQGEIRTLLIAPDGTLFAGTASESGGSSSGRTSLALSRGDLLASNSPMITSGTIAAAETPKTTESKEKSSSDKASSEGGTAAPKAVSEGENSVYRIGGDGIPREVFRAKLLIYALAWREDRLLVGTGPEGLLYEIRGLGREATPIARLDSGQILALRADRAKGLLLGAGDPGAVARLDAGYVADGTFVSEVLDAKLISRFGALSWSAEQPAGTSVALQVRTGNVGDPDATWSPWSAAQTDPGGSKAESPPGRFAQYRATLATRDPAASPELRSVALCYQTANLPPEITKIEVPDLGGSDGATRQTSLTIKWDVTDPNGDDLSYTLHVRKEGWPDWVRLGDAAITASSYEWDTTALPAGLYRLRLDASDRPSNGAEDALLSDRATDPFIVDHEPPTVALVDRSRAVTATLGDNFTRLVKAAYALDGRDWVPIFPDDGLFDTTRETITIALPDLRRGTHILVVRTTDAAGNVGTGDTLLDVKD